MVLAKVKEQDGIIRKVPSIPTSAACCNDLQQMRNPFPILFTTVNYFIGLRPIGREQDGIMLAKVKVPSKGHTSAA